MAERSGLRHEVTVDVMWSMAMTMVRTILCSSIAEESGLRDRLYSGYQESISDAVFTSYSSSFLYSVVLPTEFFVRVHPLLS